jgi:hypothetical protein
LYPNPEKEGIYLKVLIVEPDYAPYEKEINGLHEMQAVVGGSIQAIYPYKEQVAIVCNEEGILNGLPFNRSMEGGYGGVFGTFFVCGLGEESFCSLTQEQVKTYKEKFRHAEILIGAIGNEAVTIKVEPREKNKPPKGHDRPTQPGRE